MSAAAAAEPEQQRFDQSSGISTPRPDPTVATTAALASEATARVESIKALKEQIESELAIRDQRLEGIDEATKLRLSTIADVPERIDAASRNEATVALVRFTALDRFSMASIAHLREITEIRFSAAERLATRESELNALALAAAFAAQKEAAATSGSTFADALTALTTLFRTTFEAQGTNISDLKERVVRAESNRQGAVESRVEARQSNAAVYALVGVIISVILAALTISAFVIAKS